MSGLSDMGEPAAPPPGDGWRRGGMSATQWLLLAIIVPVVLAAAFVVSRALDGDNEPPVGLQIETDDEATEFDWDYYIPEGTADRIAAGEAVEIVPAELTVHVGDTIRIVNDDTTAHIVGVFYVGPGETAVQRFQSAGELEQTCTVHSSGSFTLRVLER